MTALLIILEIFVYLVIGKLYVNYLIHIGITEDINENEFSNVMEHMFWPISILIRTANFTGNKLSKIFFDS